MVSAPTPMAQVSPEPVLPHAPWEFRSAPGSQAAKAPCPPPTSDTPAEESALPEAPPSTARPSQAFEGHAGVATQTLLPATPQAAPARQTIPAKSASHPLLAPGPHTPPRRTQPPAARHAKAFRPETAPPAAPSEPAHQTGVDTAKPSAPGCKARANASYRPAQTPPEARSTDPQTRMEGKSCSPPSSHHTGWPASTK